MKIIVCVKQIRHTFARSGSDADSYYLADTDCVYRLNPYDEAALELALGMKQNSGNAEIVVLSLGPLIAENELRNCLALGADQLVRIETDSAGEPETWQKSEMLARAIKEMNGDVVLCGKFSLDRHSGQVGAFVSRQLDIPYISDISSLKLAGEQVEITRKGDRGSRQLWRCALPAVFSVGIESEKPMVSTLKGRQMAATSPIQTLFYSVGDTRALTHSTRTFVPNPRTKSIQAPNNDLPAYDRVNTLLTGSRVEKQSQLLTGTVDEQVDGIINFLSERGFLE